MDDEYFQLIAKPIVVEAYAWLAAEAFVGPGVTIGRRSVLGARSVLFKDTVSNGIYAGNPAKLIRQRRCG
ncbi:chloramphenicol acetyltransferase [Rhodopirellula sallentina SM41]|uniref:Chloramphenicol acetyltransferase n=1 Tax=Rhodopirellula sallentina SM41 TaxID=1263870 RepID=M5U5H5_9BACT|nr:chloramphenicol acetyltransferase [Rhodopirellula sallentina SM41]